MLTKTKKSIVLLQGVFQPSVFDLLKVQNPKEVTVLEGRPRLDAAKVSSRELLKRKITPTLIADSMAGFLFYKDLVREVWLAYQTADDKGALCSIGSLTLGVLAKKHKVPVCLYPSGQESELMGSQKDILYFNGIKVAPDNIRGYVPLMEWVERKYITKVYPAYQII